MPPFLFPVFAVFFALCTAHYFYVFLYRPILFDAMSDKWTTLKTPVKYLLVSIYHFGVIIGIGGMIYLGLKEIFRFVAPAYLPSDDALGIFGSVLAMIGMARLTKIGRLLTAQNIALNSRGPAI